MRFLSRILPLILLIVATPAQAIQLHWLGGSTNLTAVADSQAVLVVQVDPAEVVLPNSWHLQWTADTLGFGFSTFATACLVDTAKVDSIGLPSTPADSAANQVTAQFCSSGGSNASIAYFLVDLSAISHGKLKIVALDPADPDSARVLESNEVTFNGGVAGSYAPTVLRLTSDHSTTTLRVEAIGADLSGIEAMSLSAPELQMDVALALGTPSAHSLVATATIAVPLPDCRVLVEASRGVVSTEEVPADIVETTEVPDQAYYRDPSYPSVYPKDFAFINAPTPVDGVWRNLFHIFYIRHWSDGRTDSTNEVTFGHAWSRDLINWTQTSSTLDAFHANTGNAAAWDHLHVWAPSVVQFGTKFYMFYTGVADNGDQTIGYASADSIYTTGTSATWARQSNYTLSPGQITSGWASTFHLWNFRDPYVMPDPQNPTSRLLMFYTAKTSADTAHYAVGVVRSAPNNPATWTDIGAYTTTDYTHTLVGRLESPCVFPDSSNQAPGQDFAATWRIMFTMGDWDFPDSTRIILFDSKVAGTDVTDLNASHWSTTPTNLYDYLHLTSDSPEYGHQASEMLNVGGTYFWAGFDGADIRFRRVRWGGDGQGINQFWLTNVGQIAGVGGPGTARTLRLAVAGLNPSHGATRFRIEMPARMRTTLVVYDVMGRKVRPLLDREISPGSSEVVWDGRDQAGTAVGTGMYFARMIAGGTSHVVRVPLVR